MSRRVLVTGAGSGLGLAIAERLAARGDTVIGTVRDGDRAAALSRASAIEYRALELGDVASVDALAARIGVIDVVVHNAGHGLFGPVEATPPGAFERELRVNVLGPLRLTRALLPVLRARRGRILWIGSLAGRFALPFQAHYSAAKAAIASVSDAMRIELAPLGVRVTSIEPGDFATGFTDARDWGEPLQEPWARRAAACRAAIERTERSAPPPDEVARVVDRVSRARRPPARRPVGRWARTLCLLHRLLPDRLRESLVARTYRV